MGLLETGRPTRDYTNNHKKFTVTLYEGDLEYTENGIDRKTGKTVGQHSLTAPIKLHQLLELHEDSTARNIILQPAEAGSEKIVAKLLYDPEMTWKPDASYTTKNRLPQEDCEWGTYPSRSATVEWFGKAVDEIDVVADNGAIEPYDCMEYVKFENGKDTFKKSNGTTNIIALANVEANKGGKLPVLEGYQFYGAKEE